MARLPRRDSTTRSGEQKVDTITVDSRLWCCQRRWESRISYEGRTAPTLKTLQVLHRLHPSRITFENFDPLLKRPVRLDPASLIDKIVNRGRGGYCYEQNTLFEHVLRALGYSVSGLAARVQWNAPRDVVRSRTHMVLRVWLPDDHYIVDVGFSLLTLIAPLLLEPDIEQSTPHGLHRMVRVGDEFQLQARLVEQWNPLYQISLQEQVASDWEVANWFTSTHPESTFTNNLMVARPVGNLRYALLDNRLSVHHPDGSVARSVIQGSQELRHVLENRFSIHLPVGCEDLFWRVASAN